ncbi:hypothetical protein [Allomuricauda sp. d1]|uniref:hypothetical protein n=1 Tax=Allomuricauda sp. d1 TaxID=3136725 RepID=UPI0031D89586
MKKIVHIGIAMLLIASCNIKKEEEGELPEVDVDVEAEAGNLPEYEVNWADVDVGTTTRTVEIPKVVVVMEEEEVEVPYLDVNMPNEGEKTERTVMIEAEVTDTSHDLEIEEIWAANNTLYVISRLEATGDNLGDKKMRVSDQVTLNAPDLNVKHLIIGERPDRVFNNQHTYISTEDNVRDHVGDGAKKIYSS